MFSMSLFATVPFQNAIVLGMDLKWTPDFKLERQEEPFENKVLYFQAQNEKMKKEPSLYFRAQNEKMKKEPSLFDGIL